METREHEACLRSLLTQILAKLASLDRRIETMEGVLCDMYHDMPDLPFDSDGNVRVSER